MTVDGKFTFIDLFAGAGGMSLGFRRAGFTPVAAYDNWDSAVRSYAINHGEHIHNVAINAEIEAPFVTVVVGGPPCQGFSSAGLRRPTDARNTLVGEFSRLIARLKPSRMSVPIAAAGPERVDMKPMRNWSAASAG